MPVKVGRITLTDEEYAEDVAYTREQVDLVMAKFGGSKQAVLKAARQAGKTCRKWYEAALFFTHFPEKMPRG